MEDDGESLPEPTAVSEVRADSPADIVTLVDVDFGEYRRKNERSRALPDRQSRKRSALTCTKKLHPIRIAI